MTHLWENFHHYCIVGGAGFIGSHFVDRLLAEPQVKRVTIYDNFTSGRTWHYAHHSDDPRLQVVHADVNERERLTETLRGHEVVIHLASNPDIARAVREPDIDFWEGTALTQHVLEAIRCSGTVQLLLYASGSGVYGDLGHEEAHEDWSPLMPVSPYGASKLAGEAMISAYCAMFGLRARAFRFGNVVGARQTHGVAFDFIRSLRKDPSSLTILGDGSQSKSYIHVDDVVRAVLLAGAKESRDFQIYNVATGDYITVNAIADLVIHAMDIDPKQVALRWTGGDRGWKGDVPIVRLKTDRIQALGWRCADPTAKALQRSIVAMLNEQEKE